MLTHFHKLLYTYPYGRSVDKTTTAAATSMWLMRARQALTLVAGLAPEVEPLGGAL
jgi:hypothetical protein